MSSTSPTDLPNTSPHKESTSSLVWRSTFASQAAGAMSTALLYPLDTLKIRFISQDGTTTRNHNGATYRSIWSATRLVSKEEGFVALLRGLHVALLGSMASWGVYMFTYRTLCSLNEVVSASFSSPTAIATPFVCSAAASGFTAVACTPIWLVKTRIQLEEYPHHHPHQQQPVRHYRSFTGGVRHIVATDGIAALWTGVSSQVLLSLPNALHFPFYELLKAAACTALGQKELTTAQVCACTAASKLAIALVAHPMLLWKTRIQDQRAVLGSVHYTSLPQSIRLVYARWGVGGMYRGFVPSMCQTVPRSVLFFVFYEKIMSYAQHSI